MPSLADKIIQQNETEREKRIRETEGLDAQAKVILATIADFADACERLTKKADEYHDITAPALKYTAEEFGQCFSRAFRELEGGGLL